MDDGLRRFSGFLLGGGKDPRGGEDRLHLPWGGPAPRIPGHFPGETHRGRGLDPLHPRRPANFLLPGGGDPNRAPFGRGRDPPFGRVHFTFSRRGVHKEGHGADPSLGGAGPFRLFPHPGPRPQSPARALGDRARRGLRGASPGLGPHHRRLGLPRLRHRWIPGKIQGGHVPGDRVDGGRASPGKAPAPFGDRNHRGHRGGGEAGGGPVRLCRAHAPGAERDPPHLFRAQLQTEPG